MARLKVREEGRGRCLLLGRRDSVDIERYRFEMWRKLQKYSHPEVVGTGLEKKGP